MRRHRLVVAQVWWRKLVAQVVVQVGGGRQVLVHKFWGAKQLYGCTTRWWHKWWRKLVVAQVVAQVWRKLVWWRKFRFLI